jgi:hypothetical protein
MNVRCRGIYTTALTERLREDHAIVQASDPIRARFDAAFPDRPADVTVRTTADRRGVGVTGDADGVAAVTDTIADCSRDTLAWTAALPAGAIYEGRVSDTRGGGAVVDCGPGEGYLPFDAVDGYVEDGDTLRVQVRDPAPPWTDDRPALGAAVRVERSLARLERGHSGIDAAANGQELAGLTDLLATDVPDGWGLHWNYGAADADMDALDATLERLVAAAADIDAALEEADAASAPATLYDDRATRWVRFGREGRFALDDDRAAVTTTMAGHHRIKAGSSAASTAVDFVEALAATPDTFSFDAVTDTFGPTVGDSVAIAHGKPDGREYSLGRGTVTERDPDGGLTVERTIRSSGTYDGLGVPREPDDTATSSFEEGRWWYPTVYRGADGTVKGTYVNVCTPVECFPDAVTYVDLHVDVVKVDGEIRRVDDDELDAAVENGMVPEPLAEKARAVASAIESGLG